ncbi:Kinesin-like protein [Phytophthora palmivora]|uniref:Kinesin-like protein n=1 Tax=Phytophthora palmivora TaxID=4796 RepID=A0A2P4XLZ0_9STRA|nr:Kinesin-like protein [Phytophthora palmivora]
MEAYTEAQQASAEIVRQANEEKARVAELYTQEMMARRKLHNKLMELQGNIRVFCRVRPIQPVELKSEQSALAVFFRDNDHESLDLFVGSEAGDKANQIGQKHAFEFDHVFQPNSTQEQVFEQTRALVVSALDGFNVCIFAYGQTGSGKTHTMEGPENDRGVNFRALRELFSIRDDRMAGGNFECSMKLSILEVYNETIVDLLEGGGRTISGASPAVAKGLDVRVGKNGVYVENLIEVEVFNEGDVLDLMRLGHSHRSVGSHDFNEHSSRSHLVLSIKIETGIKSDGRRRTSKLHLIDLAGSERVSKTAASGQRLKEAQNINRSLSALGDVIAALGANSKHVPYRNSKLTFLLQDSLSGNSKVLMFVNVSPVQWNAWETLCSLNFASRCRSVALGQAKAATATATGGSQGNGMQATMSMSAMIPSNSGSGRPVAPGSRPVPSR